MTGSRSLTTILAAVMLSVNQPADAAPLRDLERFIEAVYPLEVSLGEVVRVETLALPYAENGSLALPAAAQHVAAALHDAHAIVGLPAEPPASGIVPLLPVSADGSYYVDNSTLDLPLGTELIAVDGMPVGQLIDLLAGMVSVDGDRPDVRRALALRNFASLSYRAFGPRAEWHFTVQRPGEAPELVRVQGHDMAEAAALAAGRASAPNLGSMGAPQEPVLVRPAPGVALLRLESFGSTDYEAYAGLVHQRMAEVGDAKALILDVRGNQGGYRTAGAAVIQHLVDEPFAMFASTRTRVRRIPRRYRDRVRFPFVPEQALTAFGGQRDGRGWLRLGDPLAERLVPALPRVSADLLVLVDAETSSAAVEMVVALKAARPDVRVVGQETKGGCAMHLRELPVTFALDGSGAVVLLSLAEVEMVPSPGCVAGRGVMPDLTVQLTLSDLGARRDATLSAALGLVGE